MRASSGIMAALEAPRLRAARDHPDIEALAAVIAAPLPEAEAAPASLYLTFLAEMPGNPDLEALERLQPGERFALKSRVFYLRRAWADRTVRADREVPGRAGHRARLALAPHAGAGGREDRAAET